MSSGFASQPRPLIYMIDGKVHHSMVGPTRIVFKEGLISIGCADISEEAARYILKEYEIFLNQKEKVLQP